MNERTVGHGILLNCPWGIVVSLQIGRAAFLKATVPNCYDHGRLQHKRDRMDQGKVPPFMEIMTMERYGHRLMTLSADRTY